MYKIHAPTAKLIICDGRTIRAKNRIRDTCVSCIWSTGLFVFVLLSPLDVMSGGDFFGIHHKVSYILILLFRRYLLLLHNETQSKKNEDNAFYKKMVLVVCYNVWYCDVPALLKDFIS